MQEAKFLSRSNLFFLFIFAICYLVGRVADVNSILQNISQIKASASELSPFFAHLLSGTNWLTQAILSLHSLATLNNPPSFLFLLSSVSAYSYLGTTIILLLWAIFLVTTTARPIKSTQWLLLGYLLFALLGDANLFFTLNVTMLVACFIIAISIAISRELTYSTLYLQINKYDLLLAIIVLLAGLIIGFQMNLPALAYGLLLVFHVYIALTVSKRGIFFGASAFAIKAASIIFLLVDGSATLLLINPDNWLTKLICYLIINLLYPFIGLLLIYSECQNQR